MSTVTDTVFMIRPAAFGYNEETAKDNAFQNKANGESEIDIQKAAVKEFDDLVDKLKNNGIEVIVFDDTETPLKRDAVFPNNWISTHDSEIIITYPMYSEMRRAERRNDIIELLKEKFGYNRQYYFDHYEDEKKYLEGTGSMILDRDNKVVFACLSDRTSIELLEKFSILMDYKKIYFRATDDQGIPIYHTNVMMAIGEDICIICLDAIADEEERNEVIAQLEQNDKEIIEISISQMKHFAGNMIELKNKEGKHFLIMSEQAYISLNEDQKEQIYQYCDILHSPLYSIEKYGGGSARCMIAEVF